MHPYYWYYAIGRSVFVLPSNGPRPAFVHCSETWYILFSSVDLHHRHFLVNKRHLSINPFMNPVCRSAWIPDVIYTNTHTHTRARAYFTFHTFWVWACEAHKQNKQKETTLNRYKTLIPSQALPPSNSSTLLCRHTALIFLVSNATSLGRTTITFTWKTTVMTKISVGSIV
jgi:hypothetical protein